MCPSADIIVRPSASQIAAARGTTTAQKTAAATATASVEAQTTVNIPSSAPQSQGYVGFEKPTDGSGDFNAVQFVARAISNKMATSGLVVIQSVTNAGGLSPVGYVDVQPLVNQVDGEGKPTPHGTIYNLPYVRVQGGANAIILDPQVGDIGLAIYMSHDHSTVKRTKKQSNPGSFRRFSMADGLYVQGVLNKTPTQYVQFMQDGSGNPAGIKLVSPTLVWLSAPTVQIDGTNSITLNTTNLVSNALSSATMNTPIYNLNCEIAQGAGTYGAQSATFAGDIISKGTVLHTHEHLNSGGTGLGGPPA